MPLHEIPLERRTLHGHFSRELEPILTVDSGESIAFSCLDAGWHSARGVKFEDRDPDLDFGHALIGPVEVRGALAGQTLEVRIDSVRVGGWGWCVAGGWSSPLNDRLSVSDGDSLRLDWTLDPDAGVGRSDGGHELDLRPFLGVMGMPPPDRASTRRARRGSGEAISTAASSSRVPGSSSRSRSTARSSRRETPMPARGTARSPRRRSRRRSSAPS